MIVEMLVVRHGYSCANAWKKKYKGIQLTYADPELTEEGKRLCEERREALQTAIAEYFPESSYIVATSAMIRTQQTAYHMLMKGTDTKYTIFPHVAEEGFTSNNFPLPAEKQAHLLSPSLRGHLREDLRGSTNLENKSNWPKFLAWLEKHNGPSRIVLFTHGLFIRRALKIPSSNKPHNNDIYYVKVDTKTGHFLDKKKLTDFPDPPVSVKGCRISTVRQYLSVTIKNTEHRNNTGTKGTKGTRKTRKRATYSRM
jgi:broad specificity phosphatase PhoE